MNFLDLSIIDSIVVDNISSFLIISNMQIKGYKLIVKHTGECNFLLKQQYRYQLNSKLDIPFDLCAKKRIATVLKSS